jgi:hypothetical protein
MPVPDRAEVWAFAPGSRTAHAVPPYVPDPVARCGVPVAGARQVRTYDPAHVGIGPCFRCTRRPLRTG